MGRSALCWLGEGKTQCHLKNLQVFFFHERTCTFQAFWILDGEAFGPRILEHPRVTIGWCQSDLTLPLALLDFQKGAGISLTIRVFTVNMVSNGSIPRQSGADRPVCQYKKTHHLLKELRES